jgi:hypothetical protein
MTADLGAELLPLALGHDQEATACPWAQLTRRTAAYPSRIAQTALLLDGGAIEATPDIVDQLYRCDDCGRCRAHSILPGPPDLPRALWQIRSALVAAGDVPEVRPFAAALRAHGTIYGDLRPAFDRLGPADADASVLFVPGAATLHHEADAAHAVLRAVRSACGAVDLQIDAIDSGHVARELGLGDEAAEIRERLREFVAAGKYRLVAAGTPKEASGLREALAGLDVEIVYAGNLVARAGHLPETTGVDSTFDSVVFHPSETLIHRLDGFDEIDRWLAAWLGNRYVPEPEARLRAWPAAIERPAIRVPSGLTRVLAEARMEQLLNLGNQSPGRRLILTCDPDSARALREVASPGVSVKDLLAFAFPPDGRGDV